MKTDGAGSSSFDGSSVRVLELFSGIGGMCMASQRAGFGSVVSAIDINPVANQVFSHSHHPAKGVLKARNINSLAPRDFADVDALLMSPPCQPFSRNGNRLDLSDPRTEPLSQVTELLRTAETIPKMILLENVKGFESSDACSCLKEVLKSRGYSLQEFLLSPNQVGIPNSRLRYFLLAKTAVFSFQHSASIFLELPVKSAVPATDLPRLKDFLGEAFDRANSDLSLRLKSKDVERYLPVLDIVTGDCRRSCCFTKSYGHFLEGTGSIVSLNVDEPRPALRFFSPEEVALLMGFPPEFSFPESVTRKQRYRLLGNSVNVVLVAELLKLF
ncbi:unnamed protein product [Cyprideis torosa]|uniref:Uncharacterized protein n=1 Tax=Cyprideis torosa TaxID=163714 RepID=A0A7R8WKB4_9CRUS|nr:unnamed protein product [Cyprideis torosa]CAG0896851.1 unnamed protein product [Cyprideis torosa]